MTKIVFLDIETGGLNRYRHPIIQIAAQATEFENNICTPTGNKLEIRLKFNEQICSTDALERNGYLKLTIEEKEEWQTNGLTTTLAMRRFNSYLRIHSHKRISKRGRPYDATMVAGHNILTFDLPFLEEVITRQKTWPPWRGPQPINTLQVAALWNLKKELNLQSLSMEALAKYFSLEYGGAHDAGFDVSLNIEIFNRIMKEM